MSREWRSSGLGRLLIGGSAGLVLAISSGHWESATAQAPSAQQPAASLEAAVKKAIPPEAPTNPTPLPFSFKKGLALEYWTVRDPKTGVASLAGMQLAPPASSLVVSAADNTPATHEALLVTMEFRVDRASKVYVLRPPIALKDGQYEIPSAELTDLVHRLFVDVNAALPVQFDPTKPLPLSTTVRVRVTPIVKATPADPLAKDRAPTLATAGPVDLTFKMTLRRKLGPDETRP